MQHVILFTPSRCCKGRMGEAVAATRQLQYVRQRGGPSSSSMPGIDAVRPRRRRVMSTENNEARVVSGYEGVWASRYRKEHGQAWHENYVGNSA